MKKLAASFVIIILICGSALAAIKFPALTGRVVDNANLLSATTKQNLEQELANYETATTNQVVVVTVPSLQGNPIEDYSYQLGRYWGIGQKGKDNGVLMVVAPSERKVWITVGYGLEATLTDAQASHITQSIILPRFRAHDMEGGIVDGTHAILDVLGGKPMPESKTTILDSEPNPDSSGAGLIIFIIWMLFYLILVIAIKRAKYNTGRFGSSFFGSSGFSGGFGGGGFSGGGGGFGGGGGGGSW